MANATLSNPIYHSEEAARAHFEALRWPEGRSCPHCGVSRLFLENVDKATRLHTDESRLYVGAADVFASHETVKHSAGEYDCGEVNTNSAEGFFGVFKKGMKGVYQHCSEKHLNRYVTEFGFRHNSREYLGYNDSQRTDLAIIGTVDKCLTYRRSNEGYV